MKLILTQLSLIDKPTLILSLCIIICAISLSISHHILIKKQKNLNAWRILCFIPFIACIVHFAFYHLRGALSITLQFYGMLYITALLMAIWQFFYQKKHLYRISAVVIHLCAFTGMLLVLVLLGTDYIAMHNFSRQSYTESFLSTIQTMKKEYVLSDWKDIDYDTLETEILPMVEKAEQEQDEIAYGAALMTYCYRFYDGHIALETLDDDSHLELCRYLAGKDYGFSMITLDSGETVAILTEENCEANQAGIHDGTIIMKWNGEPINTAKENVECIYPEILTFPVAENEEYMKAIFLAGKGADENQVTFIDDNGKEQTVTLKSIGDYMQRLNTALLCFYQKYNMTDNNFNTYMLSEDCGYLRIGAESYKPLSDYNASITGEYPEVVSMLDQKLEGMCQNGMSKLIIDLRNNTGGLGEVGTAVASLFTKEEYFSHSHGIYKNGTYTTLENRFVPAYGKYSELKVVALVNAECCSSGDGMAENLSKCPNVTLMGITTTNGINQGVGGWCFTSNSRYVISYPVLSSLNEDGVPRIDTKADRVSRIKLDEHIPLNAEAAKIIFDLDFENHKDYELEYAVKYLENES